EHAAGVGPSRGDREELTRWWRLFTLAIATPALQVPIVAHSAVVVVAGRDRREGPPRHFDLAKGAISPAGQRAVGLQAAGVEGARGERAERLWRRRRLSKV